MKHLIFFSIFVLFSFVYGQTQHILILDSLTNQPIADVEVQTQQGSLFSDFKGEIEFEKIAEEPVVYTHPNYVTKYVVFSEKIDTILLAKKPHQLLEITIQPNIQSDFFELGYYYTKKRYQINSELHTTCTVAVFIQAPTEKVYMDKILLHMKSKQQAKQYSVYLYKPDKLGMPGKILYKRTITVDSLKKEGVINIHDLFIKMPKNGIFIGLENHEPYNSNHIGTGFYSMKNSNINIAYLMQNDKKLNPDGVWIPLQDGLGNITIPCFGLEVYQN